MRSFASSRGIQTVTNEEMISPRARADWDHWSRLLRNALAPGAGDRSLVDVNQPPLPNSSVMQDTVGCVAWDMHMTLSAGVSRYSQQLQSIANPFTLTAASSGGVLLKDEGRVGEVTKGVAVHFPGI